MKYAFIFVFSMFLGILGVSATTYTPTDDLFDSTQSDYLIRMANSQIDNFTNLNYIIFQVDDNYYLVAGKDIQINSGNVTFTNSIVISAIRNSSSYYGYYSYNISEESTTTVNFSKFFISNIDTDKSISSELFNDFQFKMNMVNIGIFVLGLCFAIFVTKERRY